MLIERLARKQPVPILTLLVWHGRGQNPDLLTTWRTLYPLGHPADVIYVIVVVLNFIRLYMVLIFHNWRDWMFMGVNQQPSISN